MLNADDRFWNRPLSYVFMTVRFHFKILLPLRLLRNILQMMKKYQQHLEEVDISYFWNKDNNLLCRLRYDTSQNISNNIKQVIRALEVNRDSQHITAYFGKSNFIVYEINLKNGNLSWFVSADVWFSTDENKQNQNNSQCLLVLLFFRED